MLRQIVPIALAILLFQLTSFSATRTVTKTSDTSDGACNADCSLREAVAAATAGDTIAFSSLFNAPQTITLTLGTINIAVNLTINGPGAKLLTISGNNSVRTFTIPAGISAGFSNLTIANGKSTDLLGGAAINSLGTLTVTNSVIRNNSAIESGGGIFSRGTLTVTNSTIRDNVAVDDGLGSAGGGIFTRGTATINGSTISNNTSSDAGNLSTGGGIFSRSLITVRNSTISGNWATDGGGIYIRDTGNLVNVTISANSAANGGGVYDNGGSVINARNTIIAGNSGKVSAPDFFGVATSQGNNLIGDTVGSTGWLASDKLNIEPMLGPLADNGGPTMTHMLLPGSPAIDAGNNCVTSSCAAPVLTTDQRGQSRQLGYNDPLVKIVDIGAYEILIPIAARVAVRGTVVSPSGAPVSRATLILTDSQGSLRFASTNGFGQYRFEDVVVGSTYVLTVRHKVFDFSPQVVYVTEEETVVDF